MDPNPTELIKRLGGNKKTAVLCEVTPQAVSQWPENGVPKHQLKFLKLARPDVFAEPKRARPAKQPQ